MMSAFVGYNLKQLLQKRNSNCVHLACVTSLALSLHFDRKKNFLHCISRIYRCNSWRILWHTVTECEPCAMPYRSICSSREFDEYTTKHLNKEK